MFKTLKKVALVLLVLVLLVLGVAAFQPSYATYSRSLNMEAQPREIMQNIVNFRAWEKWSPYEKRDPEMKRTLGGETQGKGATYAWDGNSDVGAGTMEITSVTPTEVVIDIAFTRPMEGKNIVNFTLKPEGAMTNVTWSMAGPVNFMGKLMGLFMDFDAIMAKDFDEGLMNLKTIVE
ncbi:MAG: SRPBCC family protein [Candidatus Peribacteraceae bacterium]